MAAKPDRPVKDGPRRGSATEPDKHRDSDNSMSPPASRRGGGPAAVTRDRDHFCEWTTICRKSLFELFKFRVLGSISNVQVIYSSWLCQCPSQCPRLPGGELPSWSGGGPARPRASLSRSAHTAIIIRLGLRVSRALPSDSIGETSTDSISKHTFNYS